MLIRMLSLWEEAELLELDQGTNTQAHWGLIEFNCSLCPLGILNAFLNSLASRMHTRWYTLQRSNLWKHFGPLLQINLKSMQGWKELSFCLSWWEGGADNAWLETVRDTFITEPSAADIRLLDYIFNWKLLTIKVSANKNDHRLTMLKYCKLC